MISICMQIFGVIKLGAVLGVLIFLEIWKLHGSSIIIKQLPKGGAPGPLTYDL